MKKILLILTLAAGVFAGEHSMVLAEELEIVKTFTNERPGNLTITSEGRVFITMSALSNPKINVYELMGSGDLNPFPTVQWASRPKNPGDPGIVKTIGIKATSMGDIWILDMGAPPSFQPKLVSFDSQTRKLKKQIIIPSEYLGNHPFLQDFVIDEQRGMIYIADMDFNTESGESEKPAFIAVNIKTGKIERKLESHPSLMPVKEPIVVKGKEISSKNSKGQTVVHYYGLNPISIDPENKWVYFGAMSGKKIYRIPSELLAEEEISTDKLQAAIEYYAPKPFSDGFIVDGKGNIYVSDIQKSAIGISRPAGYEILVIDEDKLPWPDGFALHQGWLYVVANELNTLPGLNNGTDASSPPYYINRIRLAE